MKDCIAKLSRARRENRDLRREMHSLKNLACGRLKSTARDIADTADDVAGTEILTKESMRILESTERVQENIQTLHRQVDEYRQKNMKARDDLRKLRKEIAELRGRERKADQGVALEAKRVEQELRDEIMELRSREKDESSEKVIKASRVAATAVVADTSDGGGSGEGAVEDGVEGVRDIKSLRDHVLKRVGQSAIDLGLLEILRRRLSEISGQWSRAIWMYKSMSRMHNNAEGNDDAQ